MELSAEDRTHWEKFDKMFWNYGINTGIGWWYIAFG